MTKGKPLEVSFFHVTLHRKGEKMTPCIFIGRITGDTRVKALEVLQPGSERSREVIDCLEQALNSFKNPIEA